MLATRLHQDPGGVTSAQAELSRSIAVAISGGLGDSLRAADQHALAILEAQIPQSSAVGGGEPLAAARRALEEITRGATLALLLRDRLSAETFTTLFAPFAGVVSSFRRVDARARQSAPDADSLVLTQTDVPAGYRLRESRNQPGQAARMFGKARFLGRGDAIWSEATVFDEDDIAHDGWMTLVEFHAARGAYSGVRDLRLDLGDESYVHTGTMDGRPGLWAAVRIGAVVHRFNTYGLGEGPSLDLLRRQLSKQLAIGG